LKESKQIEGGFAATFTLAALTGWSFSEREEYQKLLKESGIPLLSVVPEVAGCFHAEAKESR